MTNETLTYFAKAVVASAFYGVVGYFATKGITTTYLEWREKQELETQPEETQNSI